MVPETIKGLPPVDTDAIVPPINITHLPANNISSGGALLNKSTCNNFTGS